jgi:hypothetical protein
MTTIASLLFGDGPSRQQAITSALNPIAGRLAQIQIKGLSVPTVDVTNALAALLEMPVGNLALQGWQHHNSVEQACDRTRNDPASREVIHLMPHKISSTQRPVIEAAVEQFAIPVLELTLRAELEVSSADIEVSHGQVTQARPGSGSGHLTLDAGGVTLADREFDQLDLTTSL